MLGIAKLSGLGKYILPAATPNLQTSLLLHGEGVQDAFPASPFIDSSTYNMPITVGGFARHVNSIKKYNSGSIYFDGTSPYDYLTVPNTGERFTFGSGNFTIEGWAYPTTFAKTSVLAAQWHPGNVSYSSWTIQLGITTGRLQGGIARSTGGYMFDITTASTAAAFTLNTWNHWAITRTGNVFASYINGVRAGTQTSTGETPVSPVQPLYIGYREGNNNFTGYMDEFRITKGTSYYSGATYAVPTDAFTG